MPGGGWSPYKLGVSPLFPTFTLCPLCDYYDHEGKCPKFSSAKWWCGPCLTSKLHPEELSGPRLPNNLLDDVGVGRADFFCLWCSVPICSSHRGPTGHCSHTDCRRLSPAKQKQLVLTLDSYVPDWRTAGPKRCESCNLPVYRYSVCRRHFDQLKNGRRRLYPGRLRRIHTEPVVHGTFSLPKSRLDAIKRIVQEEGGTVSSYLDELVEEDLRARVNELRRKARLAEK